MSYSWNPQQFAARLKETIGGEPVSSFARKCGFAESMLRKYLLGVSVPGTDKLVRMSEISGVSHKLLDVEAVIHHTGRCYIGVWEYPEP